MKYLAEYKENERTEIYDSNVGTSNATAGTTVTTTKSPIRTAKKQELSLQQHKNQQERQSQIEKQRQMFFEFLVKKIAEEKTSNSFAPNDIVDFMSEIIHNPDEAITFQSYYRNESANINLKEETEYTQNQINKIWDSVEDKQSTIAWQTLNEVSRRKSTA